MSNYKGYKLEDNIRRKSNNMTENHFDSSTNTNTKRWTTSGSQASDHQAKLAAKRIKKASKVKIYTQEELNTLNKQRKAKK